MGCDAILTCNSFDDDWLKPKLGRLLWGYPHIFDIVSSGYADVRGRNIIDQSRTWQTDRKGGPAESEKKFRPPSLSEPSTELWVHAKAEDVSSEYITQGSGWYALFNPSLERSLDVSLVHSLAHDRFVSFTASTVWIIDILFRHIIQLRAMCTLLPGRQIPCYRLYGRDNTDT